MTDKQNLPVRAILGQGSFSTVYQSADGKSAIKVPLESMFDREWKSALEGKAMYDPSLAPTVQFGNDQGFVAEDAVANDYQVLRRIQGHRSIPRLEDGSTPEMVRTVYEPLVRSDSYFAPLKRIALEHGGDDLRGYVLEVATVGQRLLEALKHARDVGNLGLHGDIKPDNVLVDPVDTKRPDLTEAVLIDYSHALSKKDIKGGILYKPFVVGGVFVAPEVKRRGKNVWNADVFSVGKWMYKLWIPCDNLYCDADCKGGRDGAEWYIMPGTREEYNGIGLARPMDQLLSGLMTDSPKSRLVLEDAIAAVKDFRKHVVGSLQ